MCERYTQLAAAETKTPRVVMWCSGPAAVPIMHAQFYGNPAYDRRIFFEWEGKPLMLVRPAPTVDDAIDPDKPPPKSFPRQYTYRSMWGLKGNPTAMWSFKNVVLPYAGYRRRAGGGAGVEQMPVAFASQSKHMYNDLDEAMEEGRRGREGGAYFRQCFEQVKREKPRIMTVCSWNEWTSQNQSGRADKGVFTDIFGPELSADCEPSREHGRKYYAMLQAAVKEFKALV